MSGSRRRKKPIWIYILLASLAFMLSVALSLSGLIQKTEYAIRDSLFEIRGPLPVENSPVVMVEISDKADSEIPQKWPWPTSVHARLIENLNRAGAKVILFDVLFSDFDRYDLANDSLFARKIAEYENVVLAATIERVESGGRAEFIRTFPNSVLRKANPNPVGLVNNSTSVDGYVRVYPFGYNFMGESYYMLGLEGIRLFYGLDSEAIDPLDGKVLGSDFKIGDSSIRRNYFNSFIINYYGPEGLFPTISYEEVIDDTSYTTVMEAEAFEMNLFEDPLTKTGHLYDGTFQDKIVIVGSTMPVLQDFHPTPFASQDNQRPGFEIHAHAIQTVLDSSYLSRQSDALRLIFMFVFSFIVVFFNRSFGASWGFAFSILLMGAYYGIVILLFLNAQIFYNVTGILMVIFFGQVGTVGFEYVIEQQEKRRIKGMFSSYVSPTLVDQMVESRQEPKLGGEEIYMTAFFSDIVSFSTFSEKLEPQQLVALINEYLTAMTDIINENGGTLDKFIGDAIVAFFGAPVVVEDHARRACISSLKMEKRLAELRKKWEQDNWPDIVINMQHRMGMNTGNMVTGNMGSERRFNYTMMGDNVNLAARCESGAKQYNVFTMVTESTKLEAQKHGDDCLFRLLDNIVVKGRTQPVKVFEVVDFKSEASQKIHDCVGMYEEGMMKYFNQEWDEAIALFTRAEELEIHTKNPSQLFIERCNLMKKSPPAEDWDGVFVMTSK